MTLTPVDLDVTLWGLTLLAAHLFGVVALGARGYRHG